MTAYNEIAHTLDSRLARPSLFSHDRIYVPSAVGDVVEQQLLVHVASVLDVLINPHAVPHFGAWPVQILDGVIDLLNSCRSALLLYSWFK